MSRSNSRLLCSAVAAAATMALAGTVSAYNQFPYIEQMGGDGDSYTPTDGNMRDDANLGGVPPGFVSPTPGDFSSNWDEQRLGTGNGVIEEIPAGFLGVPTGDGSAHNALINWGNAGTFGANRDGPFGRPARDVDGNHATPAGAWWSTVDIYAAPLAANAYGGSDFWYNTAISRTTDGPYGRYHTEASIRTEIQANGDWRVTAEGEFLADVAPNTWMRWEIEPFQAGNGNVAFEYRLLTLQAGSYVEIASTERADFTGSAAWAIVDGPRYTWFINGLATDPIPYLIVDNAGWTDGSIVHGSLDPVPEPASLGLLALGGVLALRRRNR